MVFGNSAITIDSIKYDINYDLQRDIAVITPVVSAACRLGTVLIGSLELDNHELLPSLKMLFTSGDNQLRLRHFTIVNPLLTKADSGDDSNLYKVTFKIYRDDAEPHEDIQQLAIIP
ncbi:MAG: hypothetical protein GY750_07655 [Lentisphaerae bacterium]|nr:hypothetical protein [Lentisphaerota bacterium]MCP4101283.1 hypothetical protein [Lentisphaerota bacterium]